jgi:hypothetical protein
MTPVVITERGTHSGKCRLNPNWRAIEAGDPVVSDYYTPERVFYIPTLLRGSCKSPWWLNKG